MSFNSRSIGVSRDASAMFSVQSMRWGEEAARRATRDQVRHVHAKAARTDRLNHEHTFEAMVSGKSNISFFPVQVTSVYPAATFPGVKLTLHFGHFSEA